MANLTKSLYSVFFEALKNYPEAAHQKLIETLNHLDCSRDSALASYLLTNLERAFSFNDLRLHQNLWGLNFPNPLGLAAGFDKDGLGAGMWSLFGFGFAELGAVTLHPQPGNPKPRLFRLPLDRGALNRMGANNQGAFSMAETLSAAWARHPRTIPIGINLCKSKITPLEEAAKDYLGSFLQLREWADYFVINVSSPNTPGLRSLQGGEQLEPILAELQRENQEGKPIFVKISPDLEPEAITTIVNLAQSYQLAGIIATNTTIRRYGLKTQILRKTGNPLTEETGGISGKPLCDRSTEVIRLIWQQTQGKLPIIGVGGIFDAEDAWEKITAGASLLQIYTGWIYEGPWMVAEILKGLVVKLEQQGLSHLSAAVGKGCHH